jgi:hypothetical protein
MKKIVLLALIIASFFSCQRNIKNEKDNVIAEHIDFDIPKINANKVVNDKADLLGYWVGEFDVNEKAADTSYKYDDDYSKKITFSIDKIEGTKIIGHSVVGGNIEKFEGKLINYTDDFEIHVKEPNSKTSNGKFVLNIAKNDSILKGDWVPYTKSNKVLQRKLSLKKKFFVYNPKNKIMFNYFDSEKFNVIKDTFYEEDSLGNTISSEAYEDQAYFTTTDTIFHLNPSTELFNKELVENLSKGDIFILRNLIFARHGFSFRDKMLRRYFDNIDWYMPVFSDVTKELTDIEKKNIDLLLRYEENAKEYYDVFGR